MVPVDGGAAKDLTPGNRDVPPFSLGGPDDYAISPDGAEVCYAMNADPVPAISTNSDLYVVLDRGRRVASKITINPGADASPHYSPDGKYLAWRAQFRAGYESDRWRLMVLERATGKVTNLTENLDRWVNSFTWAPDSTRPVLHHRGPRAPGHPVDLGERAARLRIAASGDSELDDMQFTPDGKTMIYTEQSGSRRSRSIARDFGRRRARRRSRI